MLALAACDGPAGPVGPLGQTGPTGARGSQGPGTNRVTYVERSTAFGADQVLPAAVGIDQSKPPLMSCFTSDQLNGVIQISDGWSTTTPYCGLVFENGRWRATARRTFEGRYVAFAIIY